MSGAFVLFFVLGIAILVSRAMQRASGVSRASWESSAGMLGLTSNVAGAKRTMTGRYRGRGVRVEEVITNSGRQTILTVRHGTAWPVPIRITPRKLESHFTEWAQSDVPTDPFEQQVDLETESPQAVAEFLTSRRRNQILRLFDLYPTAEVTEREARWFYDAAITGPEELHRYLEELLDATEDLSGSSDTSPDPTASEVEPDPAKEELLAQAASVLDQHRTAREESNREELAEPSNDEPVPIEEATIDTTALSVAAVCEELFASGQLSLAVNKTFDANFANQSVEWSGEFVRAESFRFDPVFGSQEGQKARVIVHRMNDSTFGSGEVHAVLRLDPTPKVDVRPGASVRFAGVLIKVDAFQKKLFLENARLLPTE